MAPAQTVDQIIGKYFQSIGGMESWQKLETIKMSGTSSMQGMEFPVTIYLKRPNMEKVEVVVQGMLLVPQAYDGNVAWTVNPFMGDEEPAKLDEETTKAMASKEFENEFINYDKKGHTVEFLGEEEFDNKSMYKIRMTKRSGEEVLYYFDLETCLPAMVRGIAEAGPMRGQPVETHLSDYREVDGIFMPFTLKTKVGGSTVWSAQLENIEINSDIPDELFKFSGTKGVGSKLSDTDEAEMEESMEEKEEDPGVMEEEMKKEKKAKKKDKKAKKKDKSRS